MTTTHRNPREGDIIYVMTMPMPQLDRNHILLGITHDVKDRERQHIAANTYPVQCIYARRIEGDTGAAYKIEQALLALLHPYRVLTAKGNPSETLWVDEPGPTEDDIIELIRQFPGTDIDLGEIDDEFTEIRELADEVEQERRRRRPRFRFSMNDVPIGSELRFKYDEEITCNVADGRTTVDYKGQDVNITQATRKVMEETGRAYSHGTYQATQFWKFGDKLLEAIRRENEARLDEE